LIDDALEYARRMGERTWEVTFSIGGLGALDFLGRWHDAIAGAEAFEEYAALEFQRGLLSTVALVHVRRGDPSSARELLERHRDIARSGNAEFAATFNAFDAIVLAAEGRHDEAYQAALRALEPEIEAAWWLYFHCAEAACALPDTTASHDLLERLEAFAAPRRWRAVDAQLARLRSRFPEHDALAELEASERLFRELEMPYFVAVAQIERAPHLAAAGRENEADRLVAEAHEAFERLDAKPYLAASGQERAVA
jgi:hypothetical protein